MPHTIHRSHRSLVIRENHELLLILVRHHYLMERDSELYFSLLQKFKHAFINDVYFITEMNFPHL